MKISTRELKSDSKTSRPNRKNTLLFSAISLFPEMFDAISDYGVVGRAVKKKYYSAGLY